MTETTDLDLRFPVVEVLALLLERERQELLRHALAELADGWPARVEASSR